DSRPTCYSALFSLVRFRRHPRSTLFPYTTLFRSVLEHVDVLLTAVTLDVAPPFEPTPYFRFWPVQTYLFNVTGHPTVTVPVGLSAQGLPLAVQVVGRYFDEATVLRVARAIERLSGWERQALPDLQG